MICKSNQKKSRDSFLRDKVVKIRLNAYFGKKKAVFVCRLVFLPYLCVLQKYALLW